MTVMWSRIHAELGLLPSELTHDMVVRAVEQQLRENDDLDWKQALPVPERRQEFAKDVAAMANTRGGLIVFGVTEKDERATGFRAAANGERERQMLRAATARWIRPMVNGITMDPLNDEQGDRPLLVVSVLASPDAPHVLGEKNEMGIPFRDGSDTLWMSEHQLERAYRDRFARRTSDAATLQALLDHTYQQVDQSSDKAWLIVVARPTSPTPPNVSTPSSSDVATVLYEAMSAGQEIQTRTTDSGVLHSLPHAAIHDPGTGLRRWVVRARRSAGPAAMEDGLQVELHHDGSTVMAVSTDGWGVGHAEGLDGSTLLPVRLVETALADAIALATTRSRHLGNLGILQVRAEVRQPSAGLRADFVAAVEHGNRTGQLVSGSRIIRQVVPVEAEVRADADISELRVTTRQLAQDLLHQFGVQHVKSIRD
ncbi:ATP-binding protein [Amycolatopsis sp. NPDC049688]|uniref:AlbA family DNA-binding domain-containing protein n=1 Tax=Amycolatopsis sp. NPDC049688 TaxID=3154733 RepID=UPI00343B14A9